MKIEPFRFGTQNVTEGSLTSEILNCQAAVLQEIDRNKVKKNCTANGLEWFIPTRDKHQALIWDPEWIEVTSTGWTRFHRSGRAEDWPFGTPSRGMIWARGRLVENPDVKMALFGIWLLNSWNPMNPDHHTGLRRRIVQETSLPMIRNKIETWQKQGRVVLGGGDANSIKWPGYMPGTYQPWERGLDRIWVDHSLDLKSKREGPITGVGPDLKHHSRIVRVAR